MCVYMGGGGGVRGLRENEREGYGWVNIIVQSRYSWVRVETVRSLYQFLNKHVNYS